jgi:23S rRNA (adenine2030-N6)-methyltransferase
MLSYRHAYHAGNFADVLKHLTLVRILKHLTQKDKPICCIDTHAGAGGYALLSDHAQKTREYEAGIGRLWNRDDLPEPVADYVRLVKEFNQTVGLQRYPGSPWLTQRLLRDQDRQFLFEFHPADHEQLLKQFRRDRRVKIKQSDGFQGAVELLPPKERRGLVLMDPSYELKEDYPLIVSTLVKAYKCFATGTYAIWYPVVERQRVVKLEKALQRSGIRRIQRFELGVRPDSDGYGMNASGMLVINPPWKLFDEMSGFKSSFLPPLATRFLVAK